MNSNLKNPKVSVVMSVYNGEKYLREAIESILNQTFTDFEFIIINDGSTDRTGEILSNYNDSRMVIREQGNKGLAQSLNRGIRKSRGQYIARMDADDISNAERLEKQVSFLDTHPEYVMVGTNAMVMDKDGVMLYETNLSRNDEEIRVFLNSGNPFYHGSVMFRRDAVLKAGLYDETVVQYFEDYLLWHKLAVLGKMANFPDVLYYYRLVPSSICILSASLGRKKWRIIRKYLEMGVLTKQEKEFLTVRPKTMNTHHKLSLYYLGIGNIYLQCHVDRNRARLFLLRSIRHRSWCGRAWFKFFLSFLPRGCIQAWKRYREKGGR